MKRRRPQRRLTECAQERARVVDQMLDLLGLVESHCGKPQFAYGEEIEEIYAARREAPAAPDQARRN
ncbi:hypothetical protein GCM10020255_057740 [Rhodococcus baikonurensis]